MANMLFANNCNTTLNGGITAIATSMVVTSATGFPSPTGSQYFYCTLADAATQTTIEIVKVTAVSGTTFTIVRGQDGTTGTIFASGDVVSLRLVRASLNDFPKLDEANTFTSGDQSFAGNLVFSSTGQRITADFSNSTLTNQLVFQSSTTNGNTSVQFLPNGTALQSNILVYNSSDFSNYSRFNFRINSTTCTIINQIAGTGTYLPIALQTGATETMRLFTTGGVSIGNTTDPGATNLSVTGSTTAASFSTAGNLTFTGTANRITGDFSNGTLANRVAFQTSTTNSNTAVALIPNGSATASNLAVLNNSDPTNAVGTRIRTDGSSSYLEGFANGTGTALPLVISTAGTEAMRVFVSRGVSIGNTTDPGATNLSVTGSITGGSLSGPHNGTVGATTPATGAFTTLDCTSTTNTGALARNAGQTTNTTINNTTTYTTGGVTLATQSAATNSVWRIRAFGQYTAQNSATARTARVACFWGATQLTAITSTVLINTAQTTQWQCEFTLTASSTTAIWTAGTFLSRVGSTTALAIDNATPASTGSLTTTSTLDLRFSMSSATPTDSWIVQSVTMERLE